MTKLNLVTWVALLLSASLYAVGSYSLEIASGSVPEAKDDVTGEVTPGASNRQLGSNAAVAVFVAEYLLDDTGLPDSDEDGLPDEEDNCTLVSNPAQLDVDADGFGNMCDADFNNDCIVNFIDLSSLTDNFLEVGQTEWDLNGDGVVNFIDVSMFQGRFLTAPGPSGVTSLCLTVSNVSEEFRR